MTLEYKEKEHLEKIKREEECKYMKTIEELRKDIQAQERERQQKRQKWQLANYNERLRESRNGYKQKKKCSRCDRQCELWGELCCHCADIRDLRQYYHFSAGKIFI